MMKRKTTPSIHTRSCSGLSLFQARAARTWPPERIWSLSGSGGNCRKTAVSSPSRGGRVRNPLKQRHRQDLTRDQPLRRHIVNRCWISPVVTQKLSSRANRPDASSCVVLVIASGVVPRVARSVTIVIGYSTVCPQSQQSGGPGLCVITDLQKITCCTADSPGCEPLHAAQLTWGVRCVRC
jgi:hypothetical protein